MGRGLSSGGLGLGPSNAKLKGGEDATPGVQGRQVQEGTRQNGWRRRNRSFQVPRTRYLERRWRARSQAPCARPKRRRPKGCRADTRGHKYEVLVLARGPATRWRGGSFYGKGKGEMDDGEEANKTRTMYLGLRCRIWRRRHKEQGLTTSTMISYLKGTSFWRERGVGLW